jgi:hypothetical protein
VTRCYFWRFFFDLHPDFGHEITKRERERRKEENLKIRRKKYRKTRRCGIRRTMKTVSFRMVLSTDFRPSRRVRTAPGPVVDSFRSNFRRKRSTSTSGEAVRGLPLSELSRFEHQVLSVLRPFRKRLATQRCQIAKMARYSGKRWTNLSTNEIWIPGIEASIPHHRHKPSVPNRNRDDPVLGLVVGGARTRGALFEVIRKVACAQISNMRMVL